LDNLEILRREYRAWNYIARKVVERWEWQIKTELFWFSAAAIMFGVMVLISLFPQIKKVLLLTQNLIFG
jgi:hypothetical protein